MNNQQKIKDNNAYLKKYLSDIPALIAKKNYEEAMQGLHHAGSYAWGNSCGQFACIEIENLILQLAQALPTQKSPPSSTDTKLVATVLTSIHAAGGHSRLAWRWVQLDKQHKHHIILTNQGEHTIPSQVLELVDSGRATLTLLDKGLNPTEAPNLWERAAHLRQLVLEADTVVLHIHPNDPIAPVALAKLPEAKPVVFVDHATHVFWMGACAANLVVTLHAGAYRTTEVRRGIPATHICWWSLPFDSLHLDSADQLPIRDNLKIPSDAVVLLTSGWPYKFSPIEGLSFAEAVLPILSAKANTHLIAVGPTENDSTWQKLLRLFPGRIHLLGMQDEKFMTSCYHACDIYLDSIPFSSGSALMEAGALGKPIIKFATQEMRDSGFAVDIDTIPLSAYNFTDLTAYQAHLLDLIDMPTDERSELGKLFRSSIRNWHSKETSAFLLQKIYRQAKASPKIQINTKLTEEKFEPLDRLLIGLAESHHLAQKDNSSKKISYMQSCAQALHLTPDHPLFKKFGPPETVAPLKITIAISSLGAQDKLEKTLNSVNSQFRAADEIKVFSNNSITIEKENINSDLSIVSWSILLCEGDVLENDALLILEHTILNKGNSTALIAYFDHDEIDTEGKLHSPHFKPDFNLDLLLSNAYMGRTLAVRTDWALPVLEQASGVFDVACTYRLMLQALRDAGPAGFMHLPAVLAHLTSDEPAVFAQTSEAWQALAEVLQEHLELTAPDAQLLEGPAPGTFHVLYPLPRMPLVSIIIPTRDQLPFLSRCVESLLSQTDYPAFELLIVDNDSKTTGTREFLAGLEALGTEQIRVLRSPGAFSFSRMNNQAVAQARGEFVLLLNNDAAALQSDWLTHLMRHALRDGVGAVGARLVNTEGKLQHAGIILGLHGPAEYPCLGLESTEPGYLFRAQLAQNFSAVSDACLLVSKAIYEEVGGFDEAALAISYNDVDFCLRVGQTGRRIVWAPLATLLHGGSSNPRAYIDSKNTEHKEKNLAKEQETMYQRWPVVIASDPAYSPNLSLLEHGYEVEINPLLRFDKLHGLMEHSITAFAADDTGCGHYRILQPLQAMLNAGLCTGGASSEIFSPNLALRSGANTLIFQRPNSEAVQANLKSLLPLKGIKKIYEIDDHLARVPIKSAHYEHIPKDMRGQMIRSIGLCDRLVVSTEALAKELGAYNSDVRVVPNCLPESMWGTTPPTRNECAARPAGRKPKVGWAGGVSHQGDLEMIAGVMKDLANTVDFVFFGMCPDTLRPYVKEFHPGIPTLDYPSRLMEISQDWDLAIAPLENNTFNNYKSNLKLLEYGWCGVPVVCSDVLPYQGDWPATRVKNRYKNWREAILEHVNNPESSRQQGLDLQARIYSDWRLTGDNLKRWYQAWTD